MLLYQGYQRHWSLCGQKQEPETTFMMATQRASLPAADVATRAHTQADVRNTGRAQN